MYLIILFLQNAVHGNRDALHFPRIITQVGSDELILSEIQEAEFAAAADCADGTCTLPATQHMQIQVSAVTYLQPHYGKGPAIKDVFSNFGFYEWVPTLVCQRL